MEARAMSDRSHPAEPEPAPLGSLERWLLRRCLEALGHPAITLSLWNGEEIRGSATEAPRMRIRLNDRRCLLDILKSPDLAFGEGYMDGRIEIEGDLLEFVLLAFEASARIAPWARALSKALTWRPHLNTLSRARRNVKHHYDLGNDFYALWLDSQLVYTCAYFQRPDLSLDEAQVAKLELVCRKLRLRPGERVLEAGCGWGALALHMAERHGVTVRALNVSEEQIRYAREEARRRGLEGRVEFVLDDWRNAHGRCDAFVSVGMLEHVGQAHYRALGRTIRRTLGVDGRGLLHFIGHAYPIRMNAWLDRYIFPGAHIPTLGEMLPVLEPSGFEIVDVENLRRHYARTLEHWLERFEKAHDFVVQRYDERFVRMWRLYLASSIASFRTGSCQLYQILFQRAGANSLPWTRRDQLASS
jgi:cyclopropane-fatty-acyl-phospholipid synthase